MTKPLIIVIPHKLGRAEARRRLETGIGSLKRKFASYMSEVEESWTGDRFAFSIKAAGQQVAGHLDVGEAQATIEVQLPWMLGMIAEKAKTFLQKEGTRLLSKG